MFKHQDHLKHALNFYSKISRNINYEYFERFMASVRTVSILGCGWFGLDLAKDLVKAGFKVNGSSTTEQKFQILKQAEIKPFKVLFEAQSEQYDPDFFNCDLLIISIPPGRSTGGASLYQEKIERLKNIILAMAIRKVIFISSTSVYGDHNAEVNEKTIPDPDTESGKTILAAETLLKDQTQFQLTIIRFGGLVGPGRDPGRFFAGKENIPNGKAPVNLIHLNDCIGITKSVIQKEAFGEIINACSPFHPTKMDFYTKAALNSELALPHFIAELKNWKIVSSLYLESKLDYKNWDSSLITE